MLCQNPECIVEFESKWKNNIYCSRSCAAKVNNSRYPKRPPKIMNYCIDCNTPIHIASTRCIPCYFKEVQRRKEAVNADRIQLWLTGTWKGGNNFKLSDTIRDYLLLQAGYRCTKCSFSAFHPDDGRSILEINHINGDGSDHRPENLEVICPNCHALTPNYKSRNKGHGRPYIYRIQYPGRVSILGASD